MAGDSPDYKIQKYSYKLANATNKKEASLYRTKINKYRMQQGGDDPIKVETTKGNPITEEEIGKAFDSAMATQKEQLAALIKKLEDIKPVLEKLKEELCKGKEKDCSKEIQAIYDSLRELINKISKEKGKENAAEVQKISEQSEGFVDFITKLFQEKCATPAPTVPKPLSVAQAPLESPETRRKKKLLKAAKKTADAVQVMSEGITGGDIEKIFQFLSANTKGEEAAIDSANAIFQLSKGYENIDGLKKLFDEKGIQKRSCKLGEGKQCSGRLNMLFARASKMKGYNIKFSDDTVRKLILSYVEESPKIGGKRTIHKKLE